MVTHFDFLPKLPRAAAPSIEPGKDFAVKLGTRRLDHPDHPSDWIAKDAEAADPFRGYERGDFSILRASHFGASGAPPGF